MLMQEVQYALKALLQARHYQTTKRSLSMALHSHAYQAFDCYLAIAKTDLIYSAFYRQTTGATEAFRVVAASTFLVV